MTFATRRMPSLPSALLTAIVFSTLGAAFVGHAQTNSSAASPAPKDARIGTLIETLGKTRTPSSAAISPDGTTVAWAVRAGQKSQIHLTDVANSETSKDKIVSTGSGATDCGSSEPKWSPNGEWLAYVSDCVAKTDQAGQDQVFVWSKKTGESKQLTHLTGGIDSLTWSPDG